MKGAIVRPAQREDLAAVVRLWTLLQEHNAAHDARLAPASDAADWLLDFLRGELDNSASALFVAEGDGQIVGYIFGQILRRPTLANGDCGYVADLFVDNTWRGQGVGRRLYFALRDWFHRQGLSAIELQIVRANPASQAFWRKMGFTDFLRTLRDDG